MYPLTIAVALLLPVAAAAEGLPRRVPCGPDLAKLERLTTARFDDAWPLCRLYGNFDPAAKASRSEEELATVDLSKDFEEGGAPRHVLVVCRQQLFDGEVE